MNKKDYIENFTKEIDTSSLPFNGTTFIVSIPNECYITTKEQIMSNKLIQFLADHYIINIESTFSKEDTEYPMANIGFSKTENKWYGWSHRAIFGFGVGSKVKKGDVAYVPLDKEDFIKETINFWKDEDRIGIHTENITEKGFNVVWKYSNSVPNEKIRGKKQKIYVSFPKKIGKGEWVAKTLEDAKQMAIDFANNID